MDINKEFEQKILDDHKDFEQKVLSRQEANRELLKYVESLIERFPQQRFGQILSNYILERGVDPFYEESVDMLIRVKS